MTKFESQQGELTPDPIVRLTPEGSLAVRALFDARVERFPDLDDFYDGRFGPNNLIDRLTPQEEAAAQVYVSPPGTPIVAELVMPKITPSLSYEGGW